MIIDYGIRQGSILGPMIFNLYVADLKGNIDRQTYVFNTLIILLFLNILICKYANLQQSEEEINTSLTKLTEWSNNSNLALNTGKTKSMIFLLPSWLILFLTFT
jgi:hypothetical protein